MQTPIRLVFGVLAAYLLVTGYKDAPAPSPSPVVIDGSTGTFPPAPTGEVLTASLPVKTALLTHGTPDISWRLACSFKDFAEVLARQNTDFKTTQEFQNAYVGTNLALYKKYPGMNQFQGSLNAAFDATIVAAFAKQSLVENDSVKSAPWSPQAAAAAEEAFRAISHQCYQAFLEGSKK